MYEKAPENIEVSFPVKFGVIADIENMQTLLLNFFNKVNDERRIQVTMISISLFLRMLQKLKREPSMSS